MENINHSEKVASSTGQVLRRLRSVSFNRHVNVILIPSVRDYKEANVLDYLWYTTRKCVQFREERSLEITNYIKATERTITQREALTELYQP